MNELTVRETDDAVYCDPPGRADAAVIWLHGLGADGNDFVPIVPELELPATARVRFVFPHAPVRPVTINMGMRMRAWYDILGLDKPAPQDAAGIRDSQRIVLDFVQQLVADGIPAARIVLAGFSQGGAIALHTGLRFGERLGGILALSTYLPLYEQFTAEANPARRDTPILMCHGTQDPMLPMALGTFSRDLLQKAGYTVEWREYPMQHQVCMEEIADVSTWLAARFAGPPPSLIILP